MFRSVRCSLLCLMYMIGGDCIERGDKHKYYLCNKQKNHIIIIIINTSYYNMYACITHTQNNEVTKSFFPRLIDRCSGLWKALSLISQLDNLGWLWSVLMPYILYYIVECAEDVCSLMMMDVDGDGWWWMDALFALICIIICYDVYNIHINSLFFIMCHLTIASSPSLSSHSTLLYIHSSPIIL